MRGVTIAAPGGRGTELSEFAPEAFGWFPAPWAPWNRVVLMEPRC